MKKILFSILASGALFSSCNMDEAPVGKLNDDTAIQSVLDAEKFRNGIYNNIRSITGMGSNEATYITTPEIQADMFVGTLINGNRMGMISLGNINPSDKDNELLWQIPYDYIAAVNYFLPKLETLMSDDNLDSASMATLTRFRGEAKWARAYYYYYLMDHFCRAYTAGDPAEAATGVPLVSSYNPSGDYASYPGRSSLKETMEFIEKDLTDAYNDLKAYESADANGSAANLKANAYYLSTNTVTALEARLALIKGDYAKAVSKAEELINCGQYTLTDSDNYPAIWTDDQGSELIFVPFCNQTQSSGIGALGTTYINSDTEKADYIVTSNALNMYDAENDVRYEWFFEPRELNVNGMRVVAPCFVKFPGNPTLNTGSNNALKNRPKPFRLSEMYLIVAEAAAESNQADKANKALNDLRAARIAGYENETYGGQNLINQIRAERAKELIGEGFRISDLRRWGLGFGRSVDYSNYVEYQDVPLIIVPDGANIAYSAGDHRFILPIPTGEMETNPNLNGQQNPGY